jgi:predicted lipoprotein with Yx(FWY)xxD motif
MRSILKCLLPSLAITLTVAACGSSSKSSSSSAGASAPTTSATSSSATALVKSASSAKLGSTVLTNASGMTLYALSGESVAKFICTSATCEGVWHPLIASGASAPSGGVGSLGTVKRPNGSEQVTYKGMPLYTFTQDRNAGEANGQGIKDVGTWHAVTTAASASSAAATQAAKPAESESSSSGSGGGGGGGYAY